MNVYTMQVLLTNHHFMKKMMRKMMIDEDWDAMSMEQIAEYFKDKNFFEKTSCNCPKWNRMMTRIIDKYGEIKPFPETGFGIHPDAY